ncbi:MAG: cache domain-containing protein [Proteobacteria bacterium]|nr:cache domain-containing protein [Pseudomonadota bacterium]
MFWSSGKNKLVAAISVLLVTGFLITSLASYFVSRASLRSEISHNELPLTSDNIYSEIQRDLLPPVFISSLMATDTFLRDWLLSGEIQEQQITKYLKEIKTKYNTFTSFFVSEKTRNYYHADGVLKKVSPDEKRDEWYFRVREMTADYEINVDPDLANKDAMTIFINYRVFDYDGNYIGATGVGLTVSAVKKLIEVYQQKYNRTIYFVDRSGEIKLAGSDFDNTVRNVSQFEHSSLFTDRLGLKSESSFTYKKDGQVVHTNIRYIKEFEWYLVVEQPEKETIKQIFITLIINLVICVAITIVVLILINLSVTAYQNRIETLRGIVPICSYCKQIRDDKGYWNRVEAFVAKHTEAQFSHSICPTCMEEHYPEEYKDIKEKK